MKSMKHTLRTWQKESKTKLDTYWKSGGSKALLAASPGAGKTTFGAAVGVDLFNSGECDLIIVVAPTTNVKDQWAEEFEKHGFNVIHELDNKTINSRVEKNQSIVGDREVICVTYLQLAAPLPEFPGEGFLFSLYGERYNLFFIGDEIHHADDEAKFGDAVSRVAETATKTLALSGTPFNTSGGSLSMCDVEMGVDDDGRIINKAKPFDEYSYSDAMRDNVCRFVEFAAVYGKSETEYQSLSSEKTFKKIVDLSRGNKTDKLTKLLDVDGPFMDTMLIEGMKSLGQIKQKHRDAGMLIAAMNKIHAAEIETRLKELMKESDVYYSTVVILNDTPQAHDRIKALQSDGTDIVITVKMISEGVDVKRLRVGIYAINYLTRMFFVQFIGRFIRWQNNLPSSQFARVIIPAHILLLEYAKEIEQMCLDAVIKIDGDGEQPEKSDNVEIGNDTEFDKKTKIGKGFEASDNEISIVDSFHKENPDVASELSDTLLSEILSAANYMASGTYESSNDAPVKHTQKWWRSKNAKAVKQLARHVKKNGQYPEKLYSSINRIANNHAGIKGVDSLTLQSELMKRHKFLSQLILRAANGEEVL